MKYVKQLTFYMEMRVLHEKLIQFLRVKQSNYNGCSKKFTMTHFINKRYFTNKSANSYDRYK